METLILTEADKLTLSNSLLHVLQRERRAHRTAGKKGWQTRRRT